MPEPTTKCTACEGRGYHYATWYAGYSFALDNYLGKSRWLKSAKAQERADKARASSRRDFDIRWKGERGIDLSDDGTVDCPSCLRTGKQKVADVVAALASASRRADDAELIAWAFANAYTRGTNRETPYIIQHCVTDSWALTNRNKDVTSEILFDLGTGLLPVLTDPARAVLLAAREKAAAK